MHKGDQRGTRIKKDNGEENGINNKARKRVEMGKGREGKVLTNKKQQT